MGNDEIFVTESNQRHISIHVPAWGTTLFSESVGILLYFNPRSRVGNDVYTEGTEKVFYDFNPRSRVGNDRGELAVFYDSKLCQSTFPRGERPSVT